MHEEQAHGATPVDGGDRDRWEWRRRIRANPRSAQIYRMAVAIFGLIVVLIGIILLIGIVTSVFTAVTLNRMWVAGWLRRKRPSDIVL